MKKRMLAGLLTMVLLLLLTACGDEAPQTSPTTTTTAATTTTTTTAVQTIGNKAYLYEFKGELQQLEGLYREHTVTLAKKEDEIHQKAPGITVSLALPAGFAVQIADPGHAFPYVDGLFGAQYVMDEDGDCVGVLGYLYDNSGDTAVYQPPTIYSQIWLGSLRWADILSQYCVVGTPGEDETALSQMYHSSRAADRNGRELGKEVYNPLFLCYDRDNKYAAVMELDADAVDAVTALDIAQSMTVVSTL